MNALNNVRGNALANYFIDRISIFFMFNCLSDKMATHAYYININFKYTFLNI